MTTLNPVWHAILHIKRSHPISLTLNLGWAQCICFNQLKSGVSVAVSQKVLQFSLQMLPLRSLLPCFKKSKPHGEATCGHFRCSLSWALSRKPKINATQVSVLRYQDQLNLQMTVAWDTIWLYPPMRNPSKNHCPGTLKNYEIQFMHYITKVHEAT